MLCLWLVINFSLNEWGGGGTRFVLCPCLVLNFWLSAPFPPLVETLIYWRGAQIAMSSAESWQQLTSSWQLSSQRMPFLLPYGSWITDVYRKHVGMQYN